MTCDSVLKCVPLFSTATYFAVPLICLLFLHLQGNEIPQLMTWISNATSSAASSPTRPFLVSVSHIFVSHSVHLLLLRLKVDYVVCVCLHFLLGPMLAVSVLCQIRQLAHLPATRRQYGHNVTVNSGTNWEGAKWEMN